MSYIIRLYIISYILVPTICTNSLIHLSSWPARRELAPEVVLEALLELEGDRRPLELVLGRFKRLGRRLRHRLGHLESKPSHRVKPFIEALGANTWFSVGISAKYRW